MTEAEKIQVSVIIPTYNRRQWIAECLDSVLAQTYPRIEVVVVDDRSTDGTVEWLRSEPRYAAIKLHVQERNGGASLARNSGIAISSGELIVFIDSDDMLLPKHVETAVEAFQKYPEMGLFCCDSQMIDKDGEMILGGKTWHEALSDAKGVEVKSGFRPLADVFSYSNCFPGFTLRRRVFDELGGFDQSIFPADDYDLALRVAASKYKVFYLHEPHCLRREHDGQCSGIRNSVKTQVELIRALDRAAAKTPELLTDKAKVKERLAEIRLELGMSEVKEGRKGAGFKTMLRSVASDPKQVGTLARIGTRRIKRLVGI
jgi:glycosyltransferase involved in cell wall biosynthesis